MSRREFMRVGITDVLMVAAMVSALAITIPPATDEPSECPPACAGADLQDATLDGADLAYASLVGADLEGASLRDADPRHTVRTATTFDGADIDGANLVRCGPPVKDQPPRPCGA